MKSTSAHLVADAMTASLLVTRPVPIDDDLLHITRCNNVNLAQCGLDITDALWAGGGETVCVVCADLNWHHLIAVGCVDCDER